jgi:integrase
VAVNLTSARIERFKYDPAKSDRQILYDRQHTGLGVRVRKSGRKTFVYQWGDRTDRRLLTKGSVLDYDASVYDSPLEEAIAWWREKKAKEKQGIDLQADKTLARQATLKGSLEHLVEAYLTDPDHEWSKTHARDCRRRGDVVIKRWGGLRPQDLTSKAVKDLHKEITDRPSPYEANRQSGFIHSLYEWARDAEEIDQSMPNPAHRRRTRRSKAAKRKGARGQQNTEHQRARCLMPNEGEYRRLLEAADAAKIHRTDSAMGELGAPRIREGVFVRMMLLTGCREGELLSLTWSDVNWEQRALRILDPKNSKDHYVPLGDRGIELLKSLRDPKVVSLDRKAPIFVTDSRQAKNDSEPWGDCDAAWKAIKDRADLRDWGAPDPGFRTGDLRTTVSTWLQEFRGHGKDDVAMLLNHQDRNRSVTETNYTTDLGRRMRVMRRLVEDLEGIMEICEAGKEEDAFNTDEFAQALLASNGG